MCLIMVAMTTHGAPTGTMLPAVSPHDKAAAKASAKQVGCARFLLCITEHMRQNFRSERTHS